MCRSELLPPLCLGVVAKRTSCRVYNGKERERGDIPLMRGFALFEIMGAIRNFRVVCNSEKFVERGGRKKALREIINFARAGVSRSCLTARPPNRSHFDWHLSPLTPIPPSFPLSSKSPGLRPFTYLFVRFQVIRTQWRPKKLTKNTPFLLWLFFFLLPPVNLVRFAQVSTTSFLPYHPSSVA